MSHTLRKLFWRPAFLAATCLVMGLFTLSCENEVPVNMDNDGLEHLTLERWTEPVQIYIEEWSDPNSRWSMIFGFILTIEEHLNPTLNYPASPTRSLPGTSGSNI